MCKGWKGVSIHSQPILYCHGTNSPHAQAVKHTAAVPRWVRRRVLTSTTREMVTKHRTRLMPCGCGGSCRRVSMNRHAQTVQRLQQRSQHHSSVKPPLLAPSEHPCLPNDHVHRNPIRRGHELFRLTRRPCDFCCIRDGYRGWSTISPICTSNKSV